MWVVLDMTQGLRGHNITCDNFFTSYDLGQELLKKKLTMVGTVRKNKPELPSALLDTKDRAPLSSKFAFTETTTTVSYCPKKRKNVIMMSTLHKNAAVSSREDKKPDIIVDYNRNKGGVNNLDKVTGTYTCQRKTAQWPLAVLYNILDVSAYNAFVVWTEINPGWNNGKFNKRRLFLQELGRALVNPHIEQRQWVPRTPGSANLVYTGPEVRLQLVYGMQSGRAIFHATMPLKLFHTYSRLLRFDNRESRPARHVTDKLAAIREIWDKWVERLPYLYNPGPDVTVDEQLVPFRGRCPFRQYMPSKPAKYGIKSWVACDAKSSYAWKMQVYTGKPTSGGPEENQGMRFERTSLSSHLHCLHQRRDVFSSKFAFTPTTTLVSYLPKKNKNVVLLRTLHTEADISDREDRKPAIILDYNCNKGGVDNLDKVIGTYSCRRMTARWPLVIFHNIIDVSSYNAFVIWREINPTWMPTWSSWERHL
ncbi:hypothetical protein AAFF_G00069250 [Aldrovandia affinis]|uniref:PiggyBac transposable element-derived protein domain-containing protein n=1 Tax=Aldrovandia affinis TaxID=143900 RepID=A0AAD7S1L2_9TELE|nr:hypothetical protein AAFF_G00069250 [Aldrovandia affinis]